METNLTLAEKIDRAKDGRTQKWVVKKLRELGLNMTEAQFTRKKMGDEKFNEKEKDALLMILQVEL